MRSRIWPMPFLVMLVAIAACGGEPLPVDPDETPVQARAPVDGSGNKVVIPLDFGFPVSCGTETIAFTLTGWVQIRTFAPPNNRNVELDVFHGVLTYTNSAGQTFVWHDVGPDHYYLNKNGDLILTVTGRSTASGNLERNQIVIGHVRMNLTTQEVEFVAGNQRGNIDELACAALT
jgi:hypothetical protein